MNAIKFLALIKVTEFHSAYSCPNLFLKFDKHKTNKLLRLENEK